ncbi:hypothetical protein D3C87_1706300 [compost metagenome]
MRRRDIHRPQRTILPCRPGQRLGFVVQIEPVQASDMYFGINPGGSKQALTQLWIKILGPMSQSRDRRVVTPWVER